MALNEKQQKFIREYLKDFNATEAYLRAGYKVSRAVAGVNGHKLLKNAKIEKELAKYTEKVMDKADISVESVLQDIVDTRNACKNAMVYQDEEGRNIIDTAAVNGRVKCNEQLGKYLKLFTDKLEVEISKMPEIRITK